MIELLTYPCPTGTISQWESKAKKTSAKPKAKDSAGSISLIDSSGNSRPARGGRGDGGRGGRARGGERARGGRGRAASHATTTNGHRFKENQQLSVPTDESSGWGKTTTTEDATAPGLSAPESTTETTSTSTPAGATTNTTATDTITTAAAITQPTVIPPQPTQKTWASMLRQSTAPKPTPKPKEAPAPKPAEVIEPLPPAEPVAPEPEPEVVEKPEEVAKPTPPPATVVEAPKVVEPEVALPLPEDDLTKKNLDQLPDESHPPTTATAASTAADSWDPRQTQPTSAAVTPLSASQAQHQNTRATPSGYTATALKATERPAARMPSYQRRLLEQEEAVRMPGNREVDRAAVQFGAFSLNENEDDIDGDREDPETRAQPPLESPSQPRATLPPVPQQSAPVPEAFPTSQKPAASLPQQSPTPGKAPTTLQPRERITDNYPATLVAPPTGPAATTAQRMSQLSHLAHDVNEFPAPQAPAANQQFGRFSQTNTQESTGFPQKPYEGFTQQQTAATSAGSFDSFPAATSQAPGPQNNAFSSAPGDYSSYYTADQQGRGAYNYYGQYGQQSGQNHHEGPNSQTRGFGGYNASQTDNLSQYPQSGAQQSRFGATAAADAQNSGHNTPNPASQTQQQQASAQANQPQSNLHQQPQHGSQYPYAHPYYSSPYYANYIQQHFGGGYGQGGYGGGPYGKGAMYGQPHQYGMSPQGPYDHASSPATSGFGQSSLGGRDSGIGSSIDNYGRAGSTQSGAQGGLGGFGGIHDSFGRGSAYPQAGQAFGNPNAQTSNAGSTNDDLKPYGESKATGGPSPSLAAAARPGSATNNTPAASGLPPPQSAQQGIGGYGGYPSHLQGHGLHSNQSAGSGYGLGGSSAQSHGTTPYGSFGANQGFGGYYGGRQQQQQQQQGGWGGNYH